MAKRRLKIRYARFENGVRVEYVAGAVADLSDAEIRKLGANSAPVRDEVPASDATPKRTVVGADSNTPVESVTVTESITPVIEDGHPLPDNIIDDRDSGVMHDALRAHFNADDF